MGKEILTFGDIEIEKHKFYYYKTLTFLEDLDIHNVFLLVKKNKNILLVIYVMVIKLNLYTQYSQN